MNGKITIECENKKAIFNFDDNDISVNFEPELKRDDNSKSACFISNITQIIVKGLRGE